MIYDRLIDGGDAPIAVRDFGGDQRALLLLHGAGGNLAQMTTLARALRPHHRVVTMDLRGHGRSGEGSWSWQSALGDIAAVCEQLSLDNPAVVGHSLGGMLAVLWGQRHPEAPGVVSLDGTPPPTRVEQLPGLDPAKAAGELERLHAVFNQVEGMAGRPIEADQLADLVERQQMAARDMGANEKVWIEGFRRNLVHADGVTSMRPSAGTVRQLRELMNSLDLSSIYAGLNCPSLVVLPTRNLPEQEGFGELYSAYRRYVLGQVSGVERVRYIALNDASHAMVVEQPGVLAGVITDFLRS